jgi:hypothetical protein
MCDGNGVVMQGTATISICSHCVDANKLVKAIRAGIVDAKKRKAKKELANLRAINNFLPKYPVMAYLEAEARELTTLAEAIQTAFGIVKHL